MARVKKRRRPMAEINVVPYIDVMLVLLVIFMITAPLVTQGVRVDLPQAKAEPLPPNSDEPLIITVARDGALYLSLGENRDRPLDDRGLMLRVAAALEHKPGTPVMVRGDQQVDYGRVVHAMVLAQAAGAPSVGLITEPPEEQAQER
jgi:biopolymer transport protein TolR